MSECYDSHRCCGDGVGVPGGACGECGTLEEEIAYNASLAAKVEDVAVEVALEAEAEVTGSGCWNSQHADSAGNWGWCEDCSGGFSKCCYAQYTSGCVDGKNCVCDPAHILNYEDASTLFNPPPVKEVALEAAVEAEAEATGGPCQCSCCNWCHMAECYDGHSCCDDPTCSGCGTFDDIMKGMTV